NDRRHRNPADHRAVTSLPARDFGTHRGRLRPVDDALARQVAVAEPLRDLPRPTFRRQDRATIGERPVDRTITTRPIHAGPDIEQRQTGATLRRPGVPLDGEL